MTFRQRGEQRLEEKLFRDEFLAANGQRQDDYVHVALVQAIQQNRSDLFDHANGYRGIALAKRAKAGPRK